MADNYCDINFGDYELDELLEGTWEDRMRAIEEFDWSTPVDDQQDMSDAVETSATKTNALVEAAQTVQSPAQPQVQAGEVEDVDMESAAITDSPWSPEDQALDPKTPQGEVALNKFQTAGHHQAQSFPEDYPNPFANDNEGGKQSAGFVPNFEEFTHVKDFIHSDSAPGLKPSSEPKGALGGTELGAVMETSHPGGTSIPLPILMDIEATGNSHGEERGDQSNSSDSKQREVSTAVRHNPRLLLSGDVASLPETPRSSEFALDIADFAAGSIVQHQPSPCAASVERNQDVQTEDHGKGLDQMQAPATSAPPQLDESLRTALAIAAEPSGTTLDDEIGGKVKTNKDGVDNTKIEDQAVEDVVGDSDTVNDAQIMSKKTNDGGSMSSGLSEPSLSPLKGLNAAHVAGICSTINTMDERVNTSNTDLEVSESPNGGVVVDEANVLFDTPAFDKSGPIEATYSDEENIATVETAIGPPADAKNEGSGPVATMLDEAMDLAKDKLHSAPGTPAETSLRNSVELSEQDTAQAPQPKSRTQLKRGRATKPRGGTGKANDKAYRASSEDSSTGNDDLPTRSKASVAKGKKAVTRARSAGKVKNPSTAKARGKQKAAEDEDELAMEPDTINSAGPVSKKPVTRASRAKSQVPSSPFRSTSAGQSPDPLSLPLPDPVHSLRHEAETHYEKRTTRADKGSETGLQTASMDTDTNAVLSRAAAAAPKTGTLSKAAEKTGKDEVVGAKEDGAVQGNGPSPPSKRTRASTAKADLEKVKKEKKKAGTAAGAKKKGGKGVKKRG